ncbi:MAG: TIGR03960 family B12-binding radical SAM protein [Defluviitaleaceae bacterium]|nr:TIGR03960 family B12-binding radical SAM protein [Defluviitaleaceae bacterium]
MTISLSDELLLSVEKPSRYLGGELNTVIKDLNTVKTRFLFCYPDVYEVGMSNIGLNILYYFLNRREQTYCERAFAPWLDMEDCMRQQGIPLFSLETKTPGADFHFIGFTLQYEMCYTNIINMLDLAGIAPLSKERKENDPILIAGGPCVYNPEPLADIIDIFYIGDGEAVLDSLLDVYEENKRNQGTKNQFLEKILHIDGIYVPRFYDVTYNIDGTLAGFAKNNANAKNKISKVIVRDIDNMFVPKTQMVPLIETAHYRATLELFRGCIRGCRFCQAGYTHRPVREKSPDNLLAQGEQILTNTGHEEISLSSLSTGDYIPLPYLIENLLKNFPTTNLSLPSLRIDNITAEIISNTQNIRRSSITFAPEAGSQRLRDIINKDITEEEIFNGARLAFENGHSKLKLYFMIGLPSEEQEDISAIAKLAKDVLAIKPKALIVVSSSCFVPKAFTPFQWEAQNTHQQLMDKQEYLKQNVAKKKINHKYHDAKMAVIEGVISRGDRRVGAAIIAAQKLGAKFDGWTDYFDYEIWQKAFAEVGIDPGFYAHRTRLTNEILPWDHIDIGVTKDFLIKELEKSKKGIVTKNCRENCAFCGVKDCDVYGKV